MKNEIAGLGVLIMKAMTNPQLHVTLWKAQSLARASRGAIGRDDLKGHSASQAQAMFDYLWTLGIRPSDEVMTLIEYEEQPSGPRNLG